MPKAAIWRSSAEYMSWRAILTFAIFLEEVSILNLNPLITYVFISFKAIRSFIICPWILKGLKTRQIIPSWSFISRTCWHLVNFVESLFQETYDRFVSVVFNISVNNIAITNFIECENFRECELFQL